MSGLNLKCVAGAPIWRCNAVRASVAPLLLALAFVAGAMTQHHAVSPDRQVADRLAKAFPRLRVDGAQPVPHTGDHLFVVRASGATVYTDRNVDWVVMGGVPVTGKGSHALSWWPTPAGSSQYLQSRAMDAPDAGAAPSRASLSSASPPPPVAIAGSPNGMSEGAAASAATASSIALPAAAMVPPPAASARAPASNFKVQNATASVPGTGVPPQVTGVKLDNGVPVARGVNLGPLTDPKAAVSLGQKLFDVIPKGGAMVQQYGKGQRTAIMFADPECPFCQHFEQTLQQMGNAANLRLIVLPYPLTQISKAPDGSWQIGGLHPQALGMAEHLMCMPNPTLAWHEWMLASASQSWTSWAHEHPSSSTWSAKDPLRPGCARAAFINISLLVGSRIGVNSTPTILLSNGMAWQSAGVATPAVVQHALELGAMPASKVMAMPNPAAAAQQ